ncbi:MAG: hypothetical protein ACTSUE_05420 [Promethearchaeota archaeon]
MILDIEKTVSLVTFTNAILKGQDIKFTSEHSTIRFAKHIPPPENAPADAVYDDTEIIALNPDKWVTLLKGKGVSRLRLHFYMPESELPPRIAAAFVGGAGTWVIEAVHGTSSDIYEFKSHASASTSHKHLGVHLLMILENVPPIEQTSQSPTEVLTKIRDVLEKLEKLAYEDERTYHWGKIFKNARTIPTDNIPNWYEDIVPPGIIPDENRHLIITAISSWVFGGMGSWNDVCVGGELNDALYDAIMESFVTGVNVY